MDVVIRNMFVNKFITVYFYLEVITKNKGNMILLYLKQNDVEYAALK